MPVLEIEIFSVVFFKSVFTCKSEQAEGSVSEEGWVNDEETAGEVSEEQPRVALGWDLLKHLLIFPGFHWCDLNNIYSW